MTAGLEHRVTLLLRAEYAFIHTDFDRFLLGLLGLLLRLVVSHIVGHIFVIHWRGLDVFGVLLVVALDEYFAQVGVTTGGRDLLVTIEIIHSHVSTHGQRSKGVCSFLFLTVRSAPLAARKHAIDAEAFLSVF